jgi:hypothetical protein
MEANEEEGLSPLKSGTKISKPEEEENKKKKDKRTHILRSIFG